MDVPGLCRAVIVACDPEAAQRLWVEEIGTWWPVETHGCFGAGAAVAFEGESIVETSPTGERAVWGTVTERSPAALAFTWHPGGEPDEATDVRLEFTPTSDDDVTLVTLTHDGWRSEAARTNYATGWFTVLDRMADARPVVAGEPLWFVLAHTPGPAAPPEGVFASPGFARHLEFLRSLSGLGVLVAAGSLRDQPGAGMTVVRAPDSATARRVVTAAQVDDGAVATGMLEVRVRPWRVAMSVID